MSAGKSDPFSQFDLMHQRVEELMRHLLRTSFVSPTLSSESAWAPAVDVLETADGYVVRAELAGADPARLEVTLTHDCLTLGGERPEPAGPDAKQRLHQMEIEYGRFQRSVHLPDAPEPGSVEAQYENGFLTIRVRRRRTERQVPIGGGSADR